MDSSGGSKKYIFIFCVCILIIYTIYKILEYKGVQITNNYVYILFYIFLIITALILPNYS